MYLPVPTSLPDDPHTKRLSRRLGASVATTIGHLVALWSWAMSYAPEGDLSEFEPVELAEAALWEGDPDALLDATLATGFIERDGETVRFTNWDELGGKVLEGRKANAERQAKFRERSRQQERNTDITVTSPLHNALEKNRREEIREDEDESREDGLKASSSSGSGSSLRALSKEAAKAMDAHQLGRWFAEHVEWLRRFKEYHDEHREELLNQDPEDADVLYYASLLAPVLDRWRELTHRAANAAEIELFADCLNSGAFCEEVLLPALNEAACSTDHLNAKFVVSIAARMSGDDWDPSGACRDIHPRVVEVER